MNRRQSALALVGFAVFLHAVHVVCAALIARGWNPMSADAISTAYGFVDPLFVLPKFGCLAVAVALLVWTQIVALSAFLKNDPDAPEPNAPSQSPEGRAFL